MAKIISAVLSVSALLFLAVTIFAQGKGEGGILQPQMTVEKGKGTYKEPLGTLGEKPAQPWTATTFGASVDGKPNNAAIKTVVGEIIDFSCYLQVGKHGEKHVGCAQKCLKAGQPIGLLTETGDIYVLMEEEHDPRRDGLGTFRDAAIEHTGHIMEVSGTASTVRGFQALYIQGFTKK